MSRDVNVNRRISGRRNENAIYNTALKYTSCIYRNIYLPTVLTKKHTTEIDILFYFQGTIFIIETKNIISAEGALDKLNWYLTSRSGSYKAYNPIGQNKLHTRVFKNRFYEHFGYFPKVISLVVVPCGALYDSELNNEIFTVEELDTLLLNYTYSEKNIVKYHLISFLEGGI